MGYINKVILIGNLGQDPELKFMPNGAAVCNFTIATNESWKDHEGNQQERTEWHRIVAYRKLAEICGEYLNKGKQVYIEGKIRTRSWDDKEGIKRYTTEIIADNMTMLGRRDEEMGGQNFASAPAKPASSTSNQMDDDDDLPF